MDGGQGRSGPTLDDVARVAGVSRATASRALSGRGSASEQSRKAVKEAAWRLGFTPHQAARALASNQAQAVGLVIPEPNSLVLGDPFLGGIIIGTSEAFRATDRQVILVIVRPDDPVEKVAQVIRPGQVDGAVVVSHHNSLHTARLLSQRLVPTVFVGRPWTASDVGSMYVDVDNVAVGRIATDHLIAAGRRAIAMIGGPQDMTAVNDRTIGYHTALSAAALAPGPSVSVPFTLQGGVDATRSLLAANRPFDGIFAQSDLLAAGAVQVLREAGREVPRDVAVTSVDDSEVARTSTPT
ncbi:MAG: LacI family transcriptional regulator, partial [Bifidobacteriaceae bacterium]|nr:LacI family transcriptional regulator [Bifidobacteriaceae bacterium]